MAEREWREASDMRSSVLTIGLVLLSALLLRTWQIGAGIPHEITEGEARVVSTAVDVMTAGRLDAGPAGPGALYGYAQVPVAAFTFMRGALAGRWSSLAEVGPADFYRASRIVTAVLGTLTVLLVYLVGWRWGARHALLAAGLLAVMPPHVAASHAARADVPATLVVTLALLLSLRAAETAAARDFGWAGAAAGLAASLAYGASLSLLLPLVAAWMTLDANPSRSRCALAAAGAAGAAFVLGSPHTLLDLPGFLNAFASLAETRRAAPDAGWGSTLAALGRYMGWPALVLAIAGFSLGAVRAARGPGRVRWTLAILFPVAFIQVVRPARLADGSNVLPLLPFLCLLASSAVVSGVSLLRRFDIPRMPRTALIAGLTVASLLLPSIASIRFNRDLGKRSTRAIAYDWIVERVPRGAFIVVEDAALSLPSDRYDVHRSRAGSGSTDGRQADYLVVAEPRTTRAVEIFRVDPSAEHPGPALRVYRASP